MLPDSPRYLISVGRKEEAREVLERVRHGQDIEVEYAEMAAAAKHAHASSPVEFVKILAGRASSDVPHLGRRAWLCIWLQLMASWTGITGKHQFCCLGVMLTNSESRHCVLAGTSEPGRVQLDQAEWPCGRPQHHRNCRDNHLSYCRR